MNHSNQSMSEILFSCEAIKVAPVDSPFLYTSGLIGPYYVNTHYLCGGREASERILSEINLLQEEPGELICKLPSVINEVLDNSGIYQEVMTRLERVAKDIAEKSCFDYVSGGQRRDWFFSIPLAKMLNIPHLYLFNDQRVLTEDALTFELTSNKTNALHVADLLTVGSSYLSKWIPALDDRGVNISASLNCVDRNQGGKNNLEGAGISEVRSLCVIEDSLFEDAHSKDLLTNDQLLMIKDYQNDPYEAMRVFLKKTPEYVIAALKADEKSKSRIELTIQNDLYELGADFLSGFKSI